MDVLLPNNYVNYCFSPMLMKDIVTVNYRYLKISSYSWTSTEYFDIGMVRDNELGIMGSQKFWQSIKEDNSISFIHYENNGLTIWQLTIFLHYNNVMTIWNTLIVVCNQSTDSQFTGSWTDDDCLKTLDFIPYAILIKSITLNYGMIICISWFKIFKAVTNYDD